MTTQSTASSTLTASSPLRHRPSRARARGIVREICFYLAVLVVILIALFPFYWILRTSLLSDQAVGQGVGGPNGIVPAHLTGAAYSEDFNQQGFLTPLVNSAIVAGLTTLITVVVATLAGYALARMPIRGAGAILVFILVAGFFPVLAMVGPLFLVLRNLGLLDSIWPLIIVYLVYTPDRDLSAPQLLHANPAGPGGGRAGRRRDAARRAPAGRDTSRDSRGFYGRDHRLHPRVERLCLCRVVP